MDDGTPDPGLANAHPTAVGVAPLHRLAVSRYDSENGVRRLLVWVVASAALATGGHANEILDAWWDEAGKGLVALGVSEAEARRVAELT